MCLFNIFFLPKDKAQAILNVIVETGKKFFKYFPIFLKIQVLSFYAKIFFE